jgi:hypothetical protein
MNINILTRSGESFCEFVITHRIAHQKICFFILSKNCQKTKKPDYQ